MRSRSRWRVAGGPPGDAAAPLGHRSKPPLRDPDVFARVPVKSFRYNARRESKWGGQPST